MGLQAIHRFVWTITASKNSQPCVKWQSEARAQFFMLGPKQPRPVVTSHYWFSSNSAGEFIQTGQFMRSTILWTIICSAVASALAAIAFKEAGIDAGGWGGIGAGIGVVLGSLIGNKLDKGTEDTESEKTS